MNFSYRWTNCNWASVEPIWSLSDWCKASSSRYQSQTRHLERHCGSDRITFPASDHVLANPPAFRLEWFPWSSERSVTAYVTRDSRRWRRLIEANWSTQLWPRRTANPSTDTHAHTDEHAVLSWVLTSIAAQTRWANISHNYAVHPGATRAMRCLPRAAEWCALYIASQNTRRHCCVNAIESNDIAAAVAAYRTIRHRSTTLRLLVTVLRIAIETAHIQNKHENMDK